jgi:hypothetical protein
VEVGDGAVHGLGAVYVGEHLGRGVHRDHGVPQCDQGMGDAAGAAAEIEHRPTGGSEAVDEVGFAHRREP